MHAAQATPHMNAQLIAMQHAFSWPCKQPNAAHRLPVEGLDPPSNAPVEPKGQGTQPKPRPNGPEHFVLPQHSTPHQRQVEGELPPGVRKAFSRPRKASSWHKVESFACSAQPLAPWQATMMPHQLNPELPSAPLAPLQNRQAHLTLLWRAAPLA